MFRFRVKRGILLGLFITGFVAFVVMALGAPRTPYAGMPQDRARAVATAQADGEPVAPISDSSTVTVGLMVVLLGLALAVGRNWQRVDAHIKDKGIHPDALIIEQHITCADLHPKPDALAEKYMTTTRHDIECRRVQREMGKQETLLASVEKELQALNLFLARKFPDGPPAA